MIRDYRIAALLMVALALCTKALIPQGYMVAGGAKILTVQICSDGLSHKAMKIVIPMESKQGGQGSGDGECAYGALNAASLAGADAPLLALALAFILALGFAPTRPAPLSRGTHVRPPLRGPPASF